MRVEASSNIPSSIKDLNKPRRRSLWESIVLNKFAKPLVIAFVALFSLLLVFSMSGGSLTLSVLFIIAAIGIIVVCGVIAYPRFGIFVLFVSSYLLFVPLKFPIDFPLGTLMDLLVYLLIIG